MNQEKSQELRTKNQESYSDPYSSLPSHPQSQTCQNPPLRPPKKVKNKRRRPCFNCFIQKKWKGKGKGKETTLPLPPKNSKNQKSKVQKSISIIQKFKIQTSNTHKGNGKTLDQSQRLEKQAERNRVTGKLTRESWTVFVESWMDWSCWVLAMLVNWWIGELDGLGRLVGSDLIDWLMSGLIDWCYQLRYHDDDLLLFPHGDDSSQR